MAKMTPLRPLLFFRLPLEIRLMIYELALVEAKPIIPRYTGLVIPARFGRPAARFPRGFDDRGAYYSNVSPILFDLDASISRIAVEARQTYFSRNTFEVDWDSLQALWISACDCQAENDIKNLRVVVEKETYRKHRREWSWIFRDLRGPVRRVRGCEKLFPLYNLDRLDIVLKSSANDPILDDFLKNDMYCKVADEKDHKNVVHKPRNMAAVIRVFRAFKYFLDGPIPDEINYGCFKLRSKRVKHEIE